MTVPSDPDPVPEPHDGEQEIVLRLADILPRVPTHLVKPGSHDPATEVRFSIDELAGKISRGRVTIPFERLSSACPSVFRNGSDFPGEPEVPLPLQKLLEQVGLIAPKSAATSSLPKDQLAQARAQASRIIEAARSGASTPAPHLPSPKDILRHRSTPENPATTPPATVGKAISTARGFLSLFGRSSPAEKEPAAEPQPALPQPSTEPPKTAASASPTPEPATAASLESPKSQSSIPQETAPKSAPKPQPEPQSKPTSQPDPSAKSVAATHLSDPTQPPPPAKTPEPAAQKTASPVGPLISLSVLPIFRLLPGEILKPGPMPPPEVRIQLPLAPIDAQLIAGHVDVPLPEFISALPDDLRAMIIPVPDTLVWIPLDEIFQNLPEDHLFYMPPLDLTIDPAQPIANIDVAPSAEAPSADPVTVKANAEPEKFEVTTPVERVLQLSDRPAPEAPAKPEPPTDSPLPTAEAQPATQETASMIEPSADLPSQSPAQADPPAPADPTSSTPPPPEAPQSTPPEPTAPAPTPISESAPPAVAEPQPPEPPKAEESKAEESKAGEATAEEPKAEDDLKAEGPKAEPKPEPLPETKSEPAPNPDPTPAPLAPNPELETQPTAVTPKPEPIPVHVEAPTLTSTPAEPPPPTTFEPSTPTTNPQLEPLVSQAPEESNSPNPDPAPASPRAPWMRGFQVPPPVLFRPSDPPITQAMSESALETPAAPSTPTPEAKQTVDFLASQTGVFAAAAFVEGAVFASTDFPRKPDLDALRDFMGSFVTHAREAGKRLGWSRVLTIECENYHLTAVVRDTHFIVALHHDRMLPTLAHDALVSAADELNKTAA